MLHILCYGDSNTWGYSPLTPINHPVGIRLAEADRWPGRLQQLYGSRARVIAEGLNGRTTVWDDPVEPGRNGAAFLEVCLRSHAPLDAVALMLGTNDVKPRLAGTAWSSSQGLSLLARMVLQSRSGPGGKPPRLLLISPVVIPPEIERLPFADEFGGALAHTESLKLADYNRAVAAAAGCGFLDAAQCAVAAADGIHLDAENHHKLAGAVFQKLEELLA